LLAAPAAAHDGPPYPIFVDESIESWTVSIWADPDVGKGTFYYYLTAPAGRAPEEVRLRVTSAPEDGSSGEVSGLSEPARAPEPFQQLGTLEFERRGLWRTRFFLERTDDPSTVLGELTYTLDVTPPGLGRVDILWFAFPFLLIGGLWLRVLLAQRAHRRAVRSPTSCNS
jgi:hypothetical protein